jgi:hypothetical protein
VKQGDKSDVKWSEVTWGEVKMKRSEVKQIEMVLHTESG